MVKLSRECKDLAEECSGREFTLKELFVRLGPRGAAFFSLILSLPFILWVAFPGLSLILGLLLCVSGVQIAFKKGVWVPRFLGKKRFSGDKLAKIFTKSEKWLKKIEKGIRPRMHFLNRHGVFRVISGFALAITGLLLALPLPPGTNFTPALGVALLALGMLENDGLFTLIGYGLFVVNIILYVLLPIYGITLLVKAL